MQIRTRRSCPYRPKRCSNRTDTFARSAIRGFREIRTFRCIAAAIRCRGSFSRGNRRRPERPERGSTSARSPRVFITTLVMLSAISSELRNIIAGNIATISNGFVTNALKATPFNPIIRLISRLAALAAILAIAAAFSPESRVSSSTKTLAPSKGESDPNSTN